MEVTVFLKKTEADKEIIKINKNLRKEVQTAESNYDYAVLFLYLFQREENHGGGGWEMEKNERTAASKSKLGKIVKNSDINFAKD